MRYRAVLSRGKRLAVQEYQVWPPRPGRVPTICFTVVGHA